MIIQPGIAKANMGVSREDVTFEDHVSRVGSMGRAEHRWISQDPLLEDRCSLACIPVCIVLPSALA